MEFGQLTGPGRSIKGEIVFPFEGPAEPEAPFAHIQLDGNGTSCGLCHPSEESDHAAGTATAFASRAFRPLDATQVDIEELRAEVEACDAEAEPGRCDLLRELFGNGEVLPFEFPDWVPTFGE